MSPVNSRVPYPIDHASISQSLNLSTSRPLDTQTGRSGWIRTIDLPVPSRGRCQTALRSDKNGGSRGIRTRDLPADDRTSTPGCSAKPRRKWCLSGTPPPIERLPFSKKLSPKRKKNHLVCFRGGHWLFYAINNSRQQPPRGHYRSPGATHVASGLGLPYRLGAVSTYLSPTNLHGNGKSRYCQQLFDISCCLRAQRRDEARDA